MTKELEENLKRLREINGKLPPIPSLNELIISSTCGGARVDYETVNGTSFGIGLLSKPEVGVQEMFLSKDTKFPFHVHELEIEYGIIYSGRMEVNIDGHISILEVGDSIRFGVGEVHAGKALEDTWLIAVSIPKIEGYPKTRQSD